MVMRYILGALAIVVGVLSFFSGMDRQSAIDPSMARLVPEPFRAHASIASATTAMARSDEALLNLAERAVADAPMEPRAAALLGSARALTGDGPGTDSAFRAAAMLGWREPATQIYWMQVAGQGGDWANSVLRADALLRANPRYREIGTLLAGFVDDPNGRAALAAQMAQRPGWLPFYLTPLNEPALDELRRRALAGRAMAVRGYRIGCEDADRLTRLLLDKGARDEAVEFWNSQCAQRPADAGLAVGNFEAEEGDAFGWRRHPSGDVAVRYEGEAGKRRVRIENRSRMTRLALSQAIATESGATVRVRGRGSDPANLENLVASISCDGGRSPPSAASGNLGGEGQILTVASPCPQPVLLIWARPASSAVELEALTISAR